MTIEHINAPETGCTPEEQAAWHAGIEAGREIERNNIAAQAQPAEQRAEVEALRAEVAEWKRVASAQAELHGEAETRVDIAEALLRQTLKAIEQGAWDILCGRNVVNVAAAIREHLGEPECNHCGGTGDVSGEYPGIACPDCAGTGKAQHK